MRLTMRGGAAPAKGTRIWKRFYAPKLLHLAVLVAVGVTVPAVSARAQMPVPVLGQRWDPWQSDLLGYSNSSTIGRYGCALTCVGMVLNYFGAGTDPRELNNWLKARGGFSSDLIVWTTAAGRVNRVVYAGGADYTNVPADLNLINRILDSGYPVIAETRLPYNSRNKHFVVLTGHWGYTYSINDPWYGDRAIFNDRYHDPARYIYGIRVYATQ